MAWNNPHGGRRPQPTVPGHIRMRLLEYANTRQGVLHKTERCLTCNGTGQDSERLAVPCLNPRWYHCVACQGTGRKAKKERKWRWQMGKDKVVPFKPRLVQGGDSGGDDGGWEERRVYRCDFEGCKSDLFNILAGGLLACVVCQAVMTFEWFEPDAPPPGVA